MSVNGIGGGANNVLYQQMLKGTQRAEAQRAGGEYDQKEAVAKSSGGDGKPEITKVTRKKDDGEKTPKELMEEMLKRTAEKRQDGKPIRIRAASPSGSVGSAGATNRTTAEYTQYLQAKFSYMNNRTTMEGIPTTVNVSPSFIAKSANDPEKAKYLEENLADLPNCAKKLRDSCPGLTELSISFDSDGEIAMIAYGNDDPGGKIAAENAKKKAQENRDKAEELQEKLEEKRAERKEEEKTAAEKESSRSLTEKLTVKVAEKFEFAKNNGMDIAAGAGQQFTISETGAFTSETGAIGGKIDSYS